jgi:hypothetical protein
MDRIFLAMIVSGVLLAAASTSLLVLSSGTAEPVSLVSLQQIPATPQR